LLAVVEASLSVSFISIIPTGYVVARQAAHQGPLPCPC
jgi:hypothetical protein